MLKINAEKTKLFRLSHILLFNKILLILFIKYFFLIKIDTQREKRMREKEREEGRNDNSRELIASSSSRIHELCVNHELSRINKERNRHRGRKQIIHCSPSFNYACGTKSAEKLQKEITEMSLRRSTDGPKLGRRRLHGRDVSNACIEFKGNL